MLRRVLLAVGFFGPVVTMGFLWSTVKNGCPRFPDSARWAQATNSDESQVVSVETCRILPMNVTPAEACDAWLVHHWRKGGGLPIVLALSKNDANQESRLILPVGMRETIISTNRTNDGEYVLQYKVTDPGPIFGNWIVRNSHVGHVTFQPHNDTSCTLVWQVNFEIDSPQFPGLLQKFTEFTVGTAVRTIVESLDRPRHLTVESEMLVSDASMTSESSTPISVAFEEWLDFFWTKGGGLPLPPPIPWGSRLTDVMSESIPGYEGTARQSLLRVPPLLVDTILSAKISEEALDVDSIVAEAVYQIQDPGWSTFPFLIHTHLGRVRFYPVATNDKNNKPSRMVKIVWQIEVRPFAPWVEKLLEMTASTIVRNLRVRLVEPAATIPIFPTTKRGASNENSDQDQMAVSIPKESWLGGVIEKHGATEGETVTFGWGTIATPWTWGRSGDGTVEGGDCVRYYWSDGTMPP